MTTDLLAWANAWQIPYAAVEDLRRRFGLMPRAAINTEGLVSEAGVQAAVRLEAGQKGLLMWRNNVGALKDEKGRLVRYGLANDSTALNAAVKSGDLIGCRSVLVTPAHVGTVIGQLVSRECKRPGWYYTGTGREPAQLKWIEILTAAGADAGFATGVGSL